MLTAGGRAAEFAETIDGLLDNGQTRIVVNCDHVPYFDSAGIGELVKVDPAVSRRGGALKVIMPPRPIGGWGGLGAVTKVLKLSSEGVPDRGAGDYQLRWRRSRRHRVTPLELRHAAVGYSHAVVRAAVAAGLLKCPLPDVPAAPGFGGLVTYWLIDSWEWLPPPLPDNTVAAIHRHLVASTN